MPSPEGAGAARSRRNIRLLVSYDGTDFHGWQHQPALPTVQDCLERSIAQVTGSEVRLTASGRTDAGVHALGQVAHFATSCAIPCANLLRALNNLLPPTVRVRRAEEAPPGFHPRFSARSKTYRYRILQAEICSPFLWRFVWHYPQPLDRERMALAAEQLRGRRDFTSFAARGEAEEVAGNERAPRAGGARSLVRTVFTSRLLWRERSRMLAYEISGSGFLHHMVRNIVGTLVEVGRGRLQPAEVGRILEARDRDLAGPTAPAQGLCLVRVEY